MTEAMEPGLRLAGNSTLKASSTMPLRRIGLIYMTGPIDLHDRSNSVTGRSSQETRSGMVSRTATAAGAKPSTVGSGTSGRPRPVR